MCECFEPVIPGAPNSSVNSTSHAIQLILYVQRATKVLLENVPAPTTSMSRQPGEANMKQVFINTSRTVAASMVLAVMMVISAGQALAIGPKDELKPNEVRALVANAKTPADHMKLAHHYTAMAAKHEAEAQEHEALAAEYTKNPELGGDKHPMGPNTAEHCKFFAEHCREAAKEMKAMAAAHEEMAKSLGK